MSHSEPLITEIFNLAEQSAAANPLVKPLRALWASGDWTAGKIADIVAAAELEATSAGEES